MDTTQWAAAAAGASAVTALISLAVTWHAKQIQGKSTDFANCLAVVSQLGDAIRRVRDGHGDENRVRAEFVELLNLLEALALLHNDGRIAASTRRFTGKFLEQAIGWINIDPHMRTLMRDSMTGEDTYGELKRFEKRRMVQIRDHSRFYRDRRETRR